MTLDERLKDINLRIEWEQGHICRTLKRHPDFNKPSLFSLYNTLIKYRLSFLNSIRLGKESLPYANTPYVPEEDLSLDNPLEKKR